jgi:hypothetical protein
MSCRNVIVQSIELRLSRAIPPFGAAFGNTRHMGSVRKAFSPVGRYSRE